MPLIPTDNPVALIGYYLGVASLIPVLGIATALPAIICGIIGIVKARSEPQAGGMGHAITAVVLGVGGPLFWFALLVILGMMSA